MYSKYYVGKTIFEKKKTNFFPYISNNFLKLHGEENKKIMKVMTYLSSTRKSVPVLKPLGKIEFKSKLQYYC